MTYTFPTPTTAAPFWRDMPGNQAEAALYLDVARDQCMAYAPLPEGTTEIAPSYFLAIVTQARNLKNAGVAPVGGGDFDGSGYGVSVFPLDWQVKQLLRPERGLGAVV